MIEWEAVADMIDSGPDREPRPGEPHARKNGSSKTACGLDAANMEPLPQRWEAISLDGKCSECFSTTQPLAE